MKALFNKPLIFVALIEKGLTHPDLVIESFSKGTYAIVIKNEQFYIQPDEKGENYAPIPYELLAGSPEKAVEKLFVKLRRDAKQEIARHQPPY